MDKELCEPITILLVDDNEDDIILVKESMREQKLANIVQTCKDGVQCLEYLNSEDPLPGLILLDINMPKMDGFTVLDEIKKSPKLKHIPVCMLTTSKRDEDITDSYSGGAASFVAKPLDFEDMKKIIDQFSLYWTLVARIPTGG